VPATCRVSPLVVAPAHTPAASGSRSGSHSMDNDLTLKAAALTLGFVTEAEFDRVVDPRKMVRPYVATGA
jgi:hypothetical protein